MALSNKTIYCPMCDTDVKADDYHHDCFIYSKPEQTKPDSVGIQNIDDYLKDKNCTVELEIWNAAIDAAIAELDFINDIGGAFLVRKLKK